MMYPAASRAPPLAAGSGPLTQPPDDVVARGGGQFARVLVGHAEPPAQPVAARRALAARLLPPHRDPVATRARCRQTRRQKLTHTDTYHKLYAITDAIFTLKESLNFCSILKLSYMSSDVVVTRCRHCAIV